MTEPEQPFDFEQALARLEGLVEQMERGELTLEQSLACFEQGVRLTRACRQALDQAEQKVRMLVEEDGEALLRDHLGAAGGQAEPGE